MQFGADYGGCGGDDGGVESRHEEGEEESEEDERDLELGTGVGGWWGGGSGMAGCWWWGSRRIGFGRLTRRENVRSDGETGVQGLIMRLGFHVVSIRSVTL